MKQRNYLKLVIDSQKRVLGENKPITEADENLLNYFNWFYGSSLACRSEAPKGDLKIIIDGLEHLVSVFENNEIADSEKELVDGYIRSFRFTLEILKEEYELDDATREERRKQLKGFDLNNPLKGFGETH